MRSRDLTLSHGNDTYEKVGSKHRHKLQKRRCERESRVPYRTLPSPYPLCYERIVLARRVIAKVGLVLLTWRVASPTERRGKQAMDKEKTGRNKNHIGGWVPPPMLKEYPSNPTETLAYWPTSAMESKSCKQQMHSFPIWLNHFCYHLLNTPLRGQI
ncbi:hypothetical protein CEXT_649301 [Caerostris extrusa]|uniref:Uncharacterized protein n=1 Tax=Caerostris extrusa TaxID=172846 RepID=A0AAV4Y0E6_CAEEX|nr:hypothetical protein CEXT_649301 [Caerostris extrusa]